MLSIEKISKSQLVLDKIITDEKIEATSEEIDAKIAEQAASLGKSVEDHKKTINERQLSYVENDIIVNKLFKFLKENNEIGESKPAKKTTAKKTTAKKSTAKKAEDQE